jgi:hypothetical protein
MISPTRPTSSSSFAQWRVDVLRIVLTATWPPWSVAARRTRASSRGWDWSASNTSSMCLCALGGSWLRWGVLLLLSTRNSLPGRRGNIGAAVENLRYRRRRHTRTLCYLLQGHALRTCVHGSALPRPKSASLADGGSNQMRNLTATLSPLGQPRAGPAMANTPASWPEPGAVSIAFSFRKRYAMFRLLAPNRARVHGPVACSEIHQRLLAAS